MKTNTLTFDNIQLLRESRNKGATKTEYPDVDAVTFVKVETGPNGASRYSVQAYKGKALKSDFYELYVGKDAKERMEGRVERWLNCLRAWKLKKEQERAARKAFENPLKVGDILYGSWGYEQTNVDFYEVVKVSGRKITLALLAQKCKEDGWLRGHCVPVPGNYIGLPFTRLAQSYDGKSAYVRIHDSSSASLWDGRPQYWSSYA